jgi:hypothetical protein
VSLDESHSAALFWTTTEEINFELFEVERSLDTRTWFKIGKVKSKGGNGTFVTYRFTDNALAIGDTYYRLKMIDRDGSYEYSAIKSLRRDFGNTKVVVYPNPVSTELSIRSAETMTSSI